jgi:heme exporter protein A
MTLPPPAVEAQGLARRHGGRWALRNVDITVPAGQSWMVCGPNGAGKSTLLRLLATAIAPTAGAVRLFGQPADAYARGLVGLVGHADHHYDDLSARENLGLAASVLPRPGADLDDVLARVGLAGRADEPVRGFSAGMRKRLAFARLLWKRPPLVLLDEPFAGLDPAGHAFVDGLLRGWRADGTTVLVSTHQVARVAAFCHEAVLLEGGRISWRGHAADAPARAVPT